MQPGTPLWRATPPAIFPVTLGFLGLGLAWRNAAGPTGLPLLIGDLLLGLAAMYYMFFVILYAMKVAARPGVLMEDLNSSPARAGVSALAMSLMLLAGALHVFGLSLPWLLIIAALLHIYLACLVALTLVQSAPEARAFSPFQYLPFVGLIVFPIAGLPLGLPLASLVFSLVSLVFFLIITIGYVPKLLRVRPPQPLRPSLVITLAPLSLFGLAAHGYQLDLAFEIAYWLSWLVALALIVSSRWLTSGGWTPIWGAFTFPITAFTSLQAAAMVRGHETVGLFGLWLGLAIGTPLILYIVYRSSQAWIRGGLSQKTGAAVA